MNQAEPSAAITDLRFLLVAATEMELIPIKKAWEQIALGDQQALPRLDFFRCGVGLTATAANLAGYLAAWPDRLKGYAGVILGGVAGAYPASLESLKTAPSEEPSDVLKPAGLLDICLAEREVLGDFGLATTHDGADPFTAPELGAAHEFSLNSPLLLAAKTIFKQLNIAFHSGTFITVNAATTTLERALTLARRHQGLCENMEGAAAAYVCQKYQLPLLEIRCVSNLVEDRDLRLWRLPEAIKRNAEILVQLLPRLALALVASK